jgi:hypothetical protein
MNLSIKHLLAWKASARRHRRHTGCGFFFPGGSRASDQARSDPARQDDSESFL